MWSNAEASRVKAANRNLASDVEEDLEDSEVPQYIEDDEASSALEMNSTEAQETNRLEDVECWCIDRYEYVDFDDYGPGGASSGDFPNIENCVMGRSRCNEICERRDKHIVQFEGKRQTISFCGSDSGFLDKKPQCQCLDSKETFKHSNVKRAVKKGGSARSLSQFLGAKEYAFDHYGSNDMNLAACYLGCPALCAKKQKVTGGCAMPNNA